MDNSRLSIVQRLFELFETIDQLRNDNAVLRERLQMYENTAGIEPVEGIAPIDRMVLSVGREAMVDRALRWRFVMDDESFEHWCKRAIDRSEIPEWCSWNDFIDYCGNELRAIYFKERNKEMAESFNER